MKTKILAILMSLLLVTSLVLAVGADFGDFGGDYDYGGDFGGDYGGDYGGGFDFGDDYDDEYDDDDDNYYYYSGGTTKNDDNDGSGMIGGVIIVIIIVLVVLGQRKKKGGGASAAKSYVPGATPTDAATLHNIGEYLALDPQFSEAEFKEKISNMYVKFQNSWTAKNMDDLRPYLSDNIFAQCDRQLDSYRRDNQTNIVEKIAVLDVQIRGWNQQSGSDAVVAYLKTRIRDYVVDDNTGAVVRGSKTAEKFMEYEWTLMRTSGRTTTHTDGTTVQNCPNCGAPININSTAKCEYCGSILTTDSFDWVVTNIKGISQRTVG